MTTLQSDHIKLPDFSTGGSNTAFDVHFNDNITYSAGSWLFIYEQENHHLCFKRFLCQIVCTEKLQKFQKIFYFSSS